ncbi:hypothetical protein OBJ68_05330 [Empedobacter falsenii]
MVVVIPIYKSILSSDEIISLEQCFKILGQHEIRFVAPLGLDVSEYQSRLNKEMKVEFFEPNYFTNIRGYNQLMLSLEFYTRFKAYEYMLIYQLDCFVFRDELDYWCKQGYDYIGAPWLDYSFYNKSRIEKNKFLIRRFLNKTNKYTTRDVLVNRVGNGGFSLRKIAACINTLKEKPKNITDKFRLSNNTNSLFNEDVFWSIEASKLKKPNYKIASKFSLDTAVEIGIRLNNNKLPFGCHAWHKNYKSWKNYI